MRARPPRGPPARSRTHTPRPPLSRPTPHPLAHCSDVWWEQPDHHGHGPFDVITPPVADALLTYGAPPVLCNALSRLLVTLETDLTPDACYASGMCADDVLASLWTAMRPQMGDSPLASLEPCDVCMVAIGTLEQVLLNATGVPVEAILGVSWGGGGCSGTSPWAGCEVLPARLASIPPTSPPLQVIADHNISAPVISDICATALDNFLHLALRSVGRARWFAPWAWLHTGPYQPPS